MLVFGKLLYFKFLSPSFILSPSYGCYHPIPGYLKARWSQSTMLMVAVHEGCGA